MPPDVNWRPKLRRIDDPVADDYWEYVTPEGKQRISRLTVGRPAHSSEKRLWYCPVFIEGYTTPRIKPIFGSGPVDSLMNAMTFVRNFFEENFEVLPGVSPKGTRRTRPIGSGKRLVPRGKSRKARQGKAPARISKKA